MEQIGSKLYVTKYTPEDKMAHESTSLEGYSYKAYNGKGTVTVENGDSAWGLKDGIAFTTAGPKEIEYDGFCVVIRGYRCDDKTSTMKMVTSLPYVNGCSSHQVFPPVRAGDPTMQLLLIPKGTAEQKHHIHTTTRVVYVLSGSGYSINGQPGSDLTKVALNEGDVLTFDKMTPHHFEALEEDLMVVPVHIFSSMGGAEFNHPMFNGTYEV